MQSVNAGKRSRSNPEGTPSQASIKRPRRGEIQFLPNYLCGENKDTLETRRMEILEEFKKMPADRDMVLVHQHTQRTFPLRREEIVTLAPPIAELKDRWPALFSEAQLYGEFHRITNQSLQYSFFAALDKNTAKLLKLYKERKTGAFGEKMADLLMAYEEQDKNDISATRTAALAGLPLPKRRLISDLKELQGGGIRSIPGGCSGAVGRGG